MKSRNSLKEQSRYFINQEISKHSQDSGHSFNIENAKIIFNRNCISRKNFLENLAKYLNHKVIINDKLCSEILSVAWKHIFSTTI